MSFKSAADTLFCADGGGSGDGQFIAIHSIKIIRGTGACVRAGRRHRPPFYCILAQIIFPQRLLKRESCKWTSGPLALVATLMRSTPEQIATPKLRKSFHVRIDGYYCY